jgi:hypothetical protein
VLKCALRNNLIVRDSGPSSVIEEQLWAEEEKEAELVESIELSHHDNSVVLELDLDSDTEENL